MDHLRSISKKHIIYLIIFIVTFTSRTFAQIVEIDGVLKLSDFTPGIEFFSIVTEKQILCLNGFAKDVYFNAPLGNIFFSTNNSRRMTISDSTGNVIVNKNLGIGFQLPSDPISFPNTLGTKINLFDDQSGIYGFGMGNAELQIGTYDDTKRISLGHYSGSSKSFSKWAQIDKNGLSFGNVTGKKINLFDDGIGIYGFGIASAELQIGAYDNNKHISLGHYSGSSKSFSQWAQIDKNGLSFGNVTGKKINLFDDGSGIYGFGIGPAELQIGAYDNNKHISLGHFSGTSKTFSEWVQINNGGLSMASGAYVTRGGVWTNASSRSFKENIEELGIDIATSSIMALDPVTYNYKVEPDENYLGFIAEDVPDLFATEDRKGLSSMDILSALVKVVQDQQARIEELELLLLKKE